LEYKDLIVRYYKGLVNSIYKILPIYENKDYKTKQVLNQNDGFKNFQIYLGNLLVEIYGNSQLFFCSENSIKLISIIRGMIQEIHINEHQRVKRLIMDCINICKKIINEIEAKE
jgi:hypothetical protein